MKMRTVFFFLSKFLNKLLHLFRNAEYTLEKKQGGVFINYF